MQYVDNSHFLTDMLSSSDFVLHEHVLETFYLTLFKQPKNSLLDSVAFRILTCLWLTCFLEILNLIDHEFIFDKA